jgi:DnaJ-class molecular chaperone
MKWLINLYEKICPYCKGTGQTAMGNCPMCNGDGHIGDLNLK